MTPFPKTGEHTAKNDRPAHTPKTPPKHPSNLPKKPATHTHAPTEPPAGEPLADPQTHENRKTYQPTHPLCLFNRKWAD